MSARTLVPGIAAAWVAMSAFTLLAPTDAEAMSFSGGGMRSMDKSGGMSRGFSPGMGRSMQHSSMRSMSLGSHAGSIGRHTAKLGHKGLARSLHGDGPNRHAKLRTESRGLHRHERRGGHRHRFDRPGLLTNTVSLLVDQTPEIGPRSPFVPDVPVNPGRPGFIGDDAKGGGAAPPPCTWTVVDVSVVNYGTATSEKDKKGVLDKIKKAAVAVAEAVVKKFGSKTQKGVLQAAKENNSLNLAKDVVITYACLDANNKVVGDPFVTDPLTDAEAMVWWPKTGASDRDKVKVVNDHMPKKPPVVAKK